MGLSRFDIKNYIIRHVKLLFYDPKLLLTTRPSSHKLLTASSQNFPDIFIALYLHESFGTLSPYLVKSVEDLSLI